MMMTHAVTQQRQTDIFPEFHHWSERGSNSRHCASSCYFTTANRHLPWRIG